MTVQHESRDSLEVMKLTVSKSSKFNKQNTPFNLPQLLMEGDSTPRILGDNKILHTIFQHCDAKTLTKIAQTNKFMHQLAVDETLCNDYFSLT